MQVEQLWSEEDDGRLELFARAVSTDRLAEALLALEGASDRTRDRCQAQLVKWSDLLRKRIEPDNPTKCADSLRHLLVRQLSFRGDVDNYYSPENASLSKVIERRRGMPILLSSIWIEVGRSAGIEIDGIGMPGHFIARIGGAGGALVDPFSGGCRISIKQCEHIVDRLSGRALPWNDAYLEPIGSAAIIDRVLRNLCHAFRRADDLHGLFKATRFHAQLRPEDPDPMLLHACVAEEIGAYKRADQLYREVSVNHPDTPQSVAASRRLERLASHAQSVH